MGKINTQPDPSLFYISNLFHIDSVTAGEDPLGSPA